MLVYSTGTGSKKIMNTFVKMTTLSAMLQTRVESLISCSLPTSVVRMSALQTQNSRFSLFLQLCYSSTFTEIFFQNRYSSDRKMTNSFTTLASISNLQLNCNNCFAIFIRVME